MKKIHGNTNGLKASHLRQIERLYRRKTPPEMILTPELMREMGHLSATIRRQIGVLVDRKGRVVQVMVGSRKQIVLPALTEYRVAPGRLRGLRCIHTHLDGELLNHDDLADLALLRLDLMAAVILTQEGEAKTLHMAHVMPQADPDPYQLLEPQPIHDLDIDCLALIQALEAEMATRKAVIQAVKGKETAFLVSVSSESRKRSLAALDELRDLARSGGIHVVDTQLQLRDKPDPRFLMGQGKIRDLAVMALQKGVSMIVFNQELSPAQMRSITDIIELKVIDRTQLILDIFAQRAQTREGKLQVELAQLQYLLPRLAGKNSAMSRLAGGIGGRGPGETKLEVDRRRTRQRVGQLEKLLADVRHHRQLQRARRQRNQIPVVSIIGYTNAGKSTLLNTLTHSNIRAESRLFATLDPSSRRIRFPEDLEMILTDTVGFIRDLPQELTTAFRATLEELESADLLLHVIDISNPQHAMQIRSVVRILEDLELHTLPTILVLNKMDRLPAEKCQQFAEKLKGIPVSAKARPTLRPLVEQICAHFKT